MRIRKRNNWTRKVVVTVGVGAIFYLLLLGLLKLFLTAKIPEINRVEIADPITYSYTESQADIANPERGFMKQSSIFVDQGFDPGKVVAKANTDTLVWIYFRLDNYRDPSDRAGMSINNYQAKQLDSQALATIRSTFEEARRKGLKLVVRFVYNGGPGSSSDPMQVNPDVPLSVALQHIAQIKPILRENSDVLAALQTGFVGHWGEWHSTKYMSEISARRQIVEALLDALPAERMLQIRYPRYKHAMFGGPISDSHAYNGSPLSRIGYYDDAFLKDDTDDGTFKSKAAGVEISSLCTGLNETQCWRDYLYADSRFVPVGGEASVHNPPRSTCQNALSELAKMHWSFINNGFNQTVLSSWSSGGCMDEIRKRLGYRLVLHKLTINREVAGNGQLSLRLEIENKGFASPYNPRPVYVVLQNKSGGARHELQLSQGDIRRLAPGQITQVEASVQLPNIPSGDYELSLFMPDASSSIRTRPEYAIRLANEGLWNSQGHNVLIGSFKIGAANNAPPNNPTKSPSTSPSPRASAKPSMKGSTRPSSSASPKTSPSPTPSPSPSAVGGQNQRTSVTPSPSPVALTASSSPTSSPLTSPSIQPSALASATTTSIASSSPASLTDFVFQGERQEKVNQDIQDNQQGGGFSAWIRHLWRNTSNGPIDGDYDWNGKVDFADLWIMISRALRR